MGTAGGRGATRVQERLAQQILDALDGPTCVVGPQGDVLAVNRAWTSFTLLNDGDPLATGPGADYLGVCLRAARAGDADAAAVADGLRRVLNAATTGYRRVYPCHSPSEQRWSEVVATPLDLGEATGALLRHIDVTRHHLAESEIVHRSLHDTLTDLPNRALLLDRLQQALVVCASRDCHVGLAVIDLDRFSRINDSLGHSAGDELLRLVAGRLQAAVAAGHTVARTGGNEFMVLWPDLAEVDDIAGHRARLAAAFAEPVALGPTEVVVSAAIGTAVARPPLDAEDVLRSAAASMADERLRGRSAVHATSGDGRDLARRRVDTEVQLRHAIEEGDGDGLELHYQPVVALETGTVVGVEALCRWHHPTRGMLAPAEFIPVAETAGLVARLGRWVMNRACSDAAGSPTLAGREVAVNVSARQFVTTDLLADVTEALRESGLAPERLVLEVTESAMVADELAAERALFAISGLGVRIAIDDFGTGYSSLLYLRRFPVDIVKLDRSFVAGIGTNPDDEAISASVVRLSQAVGATCVAEGVETAQQAATLRALGCPLGQGFLWSPAVPLERLPKALAATAAAGAAGSTSLRRRELPSLDPGVRAQITSLHDAGASLHTIAAALNRTGAQHPSGVRWAAPAVARFVAEGSA